MAHAHELLARSIDSSALNAEQAPVFTELVSKYGLISGEVAYARNHEALLIAMGNVANKLFLGNLLPGVFEKQMERSEIAVDETNKLRQEIERLGGHNNEPEKLATVTHITPATKPANAEQHELAA